MACASKPGPCKAGRALYTRGSRWEGRSAKETQTAGDRYAMVSARAALALAQVATGSCNASWRLRRRARESLVDA
jgi:hypothetical protein